jgi:dTDP-4-dehydrorhamnose reductase
MTRILVTGASGLLGLNLCMEAAQAHEMVGVVHAQALAQAPFRTVHADLLDADAPARLLDELEPEWVVHCAALASLDACERDPQLAQRLNTELPGRLAAEAAKRGLRFLHISTDAVFDGQAGDYREEDPPKPLSVYGRTKLEGEYAVQQLHPAAIVIRTVFYGWSLTGTRSLAELFYNRLSAGERMPGHTDRIFSPLLVNHLAKWLLQMLEEDLHGLYHVAAADTLSKYAFGMKLAERFGLDGGLIEPSNSTAADLQAARAPKLSLDCGKLAAVLGRELPSVDQGIEAFYQLHQSGYPQRLRSLMPQPAAAGPVS